MIGEAKGVARRLIKNPLLLLNLKTGIQGTLFLQCKIFEGETARDKEGKSGLL